MTSKTQRIDKAVESFNGHEFSSDDIHSKVKKYDISRQYVHDRLSKLVGKNEIERVSRGVYKHVESSIDYTIKMNPSYSEKNEEVCFDKNDPDIKKIMFEREVKKRGLSDYSFEEYPETGIYCGYISTKYYLTYKGSKVKCISVSYLYYPLRSEVYFYSTYVNEGKYSQEFQEKFFEACEKHQEILDLKEKFNHPEFDEFRNKDVESETSALPWIALAISIASIVLQFVM